MWGVVDERLEHGTNAGLTDPVVPEVEAGEVGEVLGDGPRSRITDPVVLREVPPHRKPRVSG